MAALFVMILAAVVCAWGSLCLLFWQGAWQMLYRPTATVARTPEAAGLAFTPVDFAATENGDTSIHGWWIPAKTSRTSSGNLGRYTIVYLHGNVGNLGDCVYDLAAIHDTGVNILAFDYRGYGQSQFVHPSEAHWREDANWALGYVTSERQIPAKSVILVGTALGADLALEIAAAHPELAGVVLDSPLPSPVDGVFKDARARLVPARMLFPDRYALQGPAEALEVPSLWILAKQSASGAAGEKQLHAIYDAVSGNKALAQLSGDGPHGEAVAAEIQRWLLTLHR
ncbi:MAG TPA: alpha/beta fold hydrolase [Terracidiphilus sp.]